LFLFVDDTLVLVQMCTASTVASRNHSKV